MARAWLIAGALLLGGGARAQGGDELAPIPAARLVGRPYTGAGTTAEILFINTRAAPVRLFWIGFDGGLRPYATIPPGGEYAQPTFVSHRWVVARAAGDGPIVAFIATRSDLHGDGQPQVAVIR